MTTVSLITAPVATPVTLADALAHLRAGSGEDDHIIALLNAATATVEEATGRKLMAQTWAAKMAQPYASVIVPIVPVISVDSMTYYDAGDASQSLTVSDFYLFADDESTIIRPKNGIAWPSMYDRPDALTINVVAGYAVGFVPAGLRQAILLLLGHWYENREAVGVAQNLPLAYEYLIAQHRLGWIA